MLRESVKKNAIKVYRTHREDITSPQKVKSPNLSSQPKLQQRINQPSSTYLNGKN